MPYIVVFVVVFVLVSAVVGWKVWRMRRARRGRVGKGIGAGEACSMEFGGFGGVGVDEWGGDGDMELEGRSQVPKPHV